MQDIIAGHHLGVPVLLNNAFKLP